MTHDQLRTRLHEHADYYRSYVSAAPDKRAAREIIEHFITVCRSEAVLMIPPQAVDACIEYAQECHDIDWGDMSLAADVLSNIFYLANTILKHNES